MRIKNYTHTRENLKSVMDEVIHSNEATIITRQSGGNAVILSLSSYQAIAQQLGLKTSDGKPLDKALELFKK